MATNQFSGLDKIRMVSSGLLKKHFCKTCENICSEIAINANFLFSHYVNGNYKLPQQPQFLSDWNKKHNKFIPLGL